jgi:hypothetical protein
LIHNANFFGSCIIHILYTEKKKNKKNNSSAKGLMLAQALELSQSFAKQAPLASSFGIKVQGIKLFSHFQLHQS